MAAPSAAPVLTQRCVTGFFGDLDLPLALRSSTQVPPAAALPTAMNAVYVGTTGALDT